MTVSVSSSSAMLSTLIEPLMRSAVDQVDPSSQFLADMIRYHLGWVDQTFRPLGTSETDKGKRVRPMIALLSCEAVSGRPEPAAPAAAAIEMFHNFTLVHDDIQDQSPIRRHRPTVWALWGIPQAINVGDAMFALSQTLLLDLDPASINGSSVVQIARRFNQVAAEIVAGQALDLDFESREKVEPATYLGMIRRKTAELIGFSAWSGATAGGASEDVADSYFDFGLSLGLSFQIRDDLLGIWGLASETGKAAADDIRRKKKSLPILELLARASGNDRQRLDALYAQNELDDSSRDEVLALLAYYDVRTEIERQVEKHHLMAVESLATALGTQRTSTAAHVLQGLTETLLNRAH